MVNTKHNHTHHNSRHSSLYYYGFTGAMWHTCWTIFCHSHLRTHQTVYCTLASKSSPSHELILVLFFYTVIKLLWPLKAAWREEQLQVTVYHWGKWRQELKIKTWRQACLLVYILLTPRTHGECCLLTAPLYSTNVFIQFSTTCLGMVLPRTSGALLNQSAIKTPPF